MINICHLIRFKLVSSEEFQIDKSYQVRKLLPIEFKMLKKLYIRNENFYSELKYFQFCIERKEEESLGKFDEDVKKLIMAIWFFSGKAVTMGGILGYALKNLPSYGAIFAPYKCHGVIWEAKKLQMENFSKFWNIIKNMNIDFSDIGIRYFRETMFAETDEDRVLKLTIAMERILLPDGGGELRNKFSTRAALLLENELKERKEIKKFFSHIYNLRSAIVHGSKVTISRDDYMRYFNYSRKLLSLFIENKAKWKKLLEDASLGENRLKYNLANLIME